MAVHTVTVKAFYTAEGAIADLDIIISLSIYTTFIMADGSGGMVTTNMKVRLVRPG